MFSSALVTSIPVSLLGVSKTARALFHDLGVRIRQESYMGVVLLKQAEPEVVYSDIQHEYNNRYPACLCRNIELNASFFWAKAKEGELLMSPFSASKGLWYARGAKWWRWMVYCFAMSIGGAISLLHVNGLMEPVKAWASAIGWGRGRCFSMQWIGAVQSRH